MGSSVSRPTGRTSFSVISAKARAALRCKSTLSEKERVVNAVSGEPVKKFVVVRSGKRTKFRVSFPCAKMWDRRTLEVLEKIRDRLALVLEQERLIRL